MEKNNTQSTLLYLMACAIRDIVPFGIAADFAELYSLSKFHSVTAMVATALESGGYLSEEHMDASLVRQWKDAKNKAVRKNILLDAEREQLLAFFEREGIWYMPLKGSVLKELYPKMGMRQMADNDILFDKGFRQQVRGYMKSRGYKVVAYGEGIHDTYQKPPVYNFEFHIDLVPGYVKPSWSTYYANVKQRLLKDAGNNCGYHFSDEDFYIYFIAHAFKHFENGGTGIRNLADIYIFLRSRTWQMEWDYVYRELEMLGCVDFEVNLRNLSQKLFSEPEMQLLTERERALLSGLFGAGTYGTIENSTSKRLHALQPESQPLSAVTKLRYIFIRLFPDAEHMKGYAPVCRKYPWMIPFARIYRLVKSLFLRGRIIVAELKAIRKTK